MSTNPRLKVGWAQAEITPPQLPAAIFGQLYARVSEGVRDPLYATVCAFEAGEDAAVFVGCDLIYICDELRDLVYHRLEATQNGVDASKVILHATHTHAGPDLRSNNLWGVDIGVAPGGEYLSWLADKLVEVITQAWCGRAPGAIAYGLDYAVLGRNRRWVDGEGKTTMYLREGARDRFSHFEGGEDHSLNLLAAYDEGGALTGVIVNIPCPSQEQEHGFLLSSDFWNETRRELRKRFGEHLFILPQCSAAGELTSHLLYEQRAHERMLALRKQTAFEEIAGRIADAVGRILPCLEGTADPAPRLEHRKATLELPVTRLTAQDAEHAAREAEALRGAYEQELALLEAEPERRQKPRWYLPVTLAFVRMHWFRAVVERYESEPPGSTHPAEVHVVRLGEVAFASNPFEYFLDFGTRIKVQSPAVQTFLIQLAGGGTYVPSARAVEGGGYGAVPASNPVGPEGGQVLAEHTVHQLRELFTPSALVFDAQLPRQ